MSTPKEEILSRIRKATKDRGSGSEGYAEIPRNYRRAGEVDQEGCLRLFTARLQDYGAGIYPCTGPTLKETIRAALQARGKCRLLVPEEVPSHWLPESLEFSSGAHLDYSERDDAEGVVTACLCAVALTGTLILQHSALAGKRALTLIPDYHLCVVFAEQIVETVPEAIQRLANGAPLPLTTISGPSATADIEMTRVKGVHGPRFLDVILVTP